ncbi:Gfo/Idh/MocA family oxidoreductase [bacterium]|nr:Gfo/Idh/MocA family oxidoreductase [bacterium]
MQVGIIGLGSIAEKAYLPVLYSREDIDVTITSRRMETIKKVLQRYPKFGYTEDLASLIDAKPKAVFVLTPKDTHYAICKELLSSGIDVYVEKPGTLYSAELQELIALAEQHQRAFMVGFNRRYAPLHVQARSHVEGLPISTAIFQKTRHLPGATDLRDLLIEDPIHQIDALRYYCGEAEVLSTECITRDQKIVGLACTLALAKGGNALILFTTQSGGWSETYTIHGAEKSVTVDAFSSLQVKTHTEETVWRESYASAWKTTLGARGFEALVDTFFESVDQRQNLLDTARDALKTQLLAEEIFEKVRIRSLD